MAYNSNSISNNINKSTVTEKHIYIKWNTLKHVLLTKHVATTTEITPVDAEKYKFDLYGLMRNVLGIPDNLVYPNMICNGYACSTHYSGELLRFKILDSAVLSTYYRLFMNNNG